MTSPINTHAHAHVAKAAGERPLNPGQQAKAAEPAVTGRAFGQLVSSIAKAKHEAPVAPPVSEPVPPVVTPPVDGAGAVVNVQA